MRQIPIIAAILVAAVLTPVAASADRMWIGFHDDPVLRYEGEKASDMEVATKTNKATILRTLVTWANIAPGLVIHLVIFVWALWLLLRASAA